VRKLSRFARVVLAVLTLAVAAMPVSGAHLHLCFDGGEPPTSYHAMSDAGEAAHNAPDGLSHHDCDISAQSGLLAKKAGSAFDLPGLVSLAGYCVRVSVAIPEPLVRFHPVLAVSLRVHHRLPPLRGPPV
jgi:hypothetical protein